MSPLHLRPPIPSCPYLVLFSKFSKLISLLLSVRASVVAIIAGSRAWMFILLGLDAKFAPALISSS